MKKLIYLLAVAAVLLAGFTGARAAVTQTKFKLKYNTTSCRYEVWLFVVAGSASYGASSSEIVAYPGLVTIVTDSSIPNSAIPTGFSGLSKISSYYPQGSQNGGQTLDGAGTAVWLINTGNVQKGDATHGLNGFKAWAFSAPTQGGAYWPALNTGDSLRLFDFALPAVNCGTAVRLWSNNVIQAGPGAGTFTSPPADPPSSQWFGKDFNNGYNFYNASTNTPTQTYAGNLAGVTSLPLPTISGFSLILSGGNIVSNPTITAGAGNCATLSSYIYAGPNGFSSTVNLSSPPITSTTAPLSRPIIAANSGNYTLTVNNSNGCTTAQVVGIVLPVKLLSFSGRAKGCSAELSWQLPVAQRDVQSYEVQYSADGIRFATVGQVDRNLYNEAYTFSYTQSTGKGYYRLKEVELGGKYSYSEVLSVTTSCDNGRISISPNPTSSTSTVTGIEVGDQVKVTDMLGNTVANYVSGAEKATIDLSIFPAGIYSVIISRNAEVLKAEKITKQ
jgi:hypothetical protein